MKIKIGVLVQKLTAPRKQSSTLGHTDSMTLTKVCDQYGKGKFVQMEALSA